VVQTAGMVGVKVSEDYFAYIFWTDADLNQVRSGLLFRTYIHPNR
jgi:hypothetical protein